MPAAEREHICVYGPMSSLRGAGRHKRPLQVRFMGDG
jgi:hypothetical protein